MSVILTEDEDWPDPENRDVWAWRSDNWTAGDYEFFVSNDDRFFFREINSNGMIRIASREEAKKWFLENMVPAAFRADFAKGN
ncbi:MAG: hypothetical protein HZA90_09440 [Verrucomicrobia bacterium]|nr:hypothetical protein [Verrucomicrobiota bacterium]